MEKSVTAYGWVLKIDMAGGRIDRLSNNGNLILGTFNRIDGKKGNTHVCIPNFGAEGEKEYGLPFHGPARSATWELLNNGKKENVLSITARLVPTDLYQSTLTVIQKFILEKDRFYHEITVTNTGTKSVPVNIGIHNYWATPAGWEGAMLNGEDITLKVKENGFSGLKKINDITFPGNLTYRWAIGGFKDAVLWTGRKDGAYDQKYVCIEPVCCYNPHFFGSPESMLDTNTSFKVFQEVCLTKQ